MFFDITDPFCTPILRGIENALYQCSYVPIFADAHNQRNRFERYLEMLLDRHVNVDRGSELAFCGHSSACGHRQAKYSGCYYRVGITGDTVSSVMVDNEAGGRLALEHLYQLGHRKIAFVSWAKDAD